jgi:putative selenium metabolism hydrolase
VLEETQGLGSRHLAEREPRPSAVIIGESTNLDVSLGHRGSIGATITTRGVSCHASAPERGINALYKTAPILQRIRHAADKLPSHPVLGKSTMTATTISLNPNIKNVVPNSCAVGLDVRNTPNFPADAVIRGLQDLVNEQRRTDPELEAEVEIGRRMIRSYTGLELELDLVTPPFYIESDSSLARMTKEAATTFLGRKAQFKVWQFATDGPYFAQKGIPTVGFGPGEERFAHSAQDSVRVDDLVLAAKVYALLAVRCCSEDAA